MFYSKVLWYYATFVMILLLVQKISATESIANVAVLRLLDKTTARTSTIEAIIGKTFDVTGITTLQVTVRACITRQLIEIPPESAAFLDILEVRKELIDVFHGWMFATSSSLSAMEHPIYDVWVLACYNSSKIGTDNSLHNGKHW